MEFEVCNWQELTGRGRKKDTSSYSWFACQNRFLKDTFSLSNEERVVFLGILAESSEQNSKFVKIQTEILSILTKISQKKLEKALRNLCKYGFLQEITSDSEIPGARLQTDITDITDNTDSASLRLARFESHIDHNNDPIEQAENQTQKVPYEDFQKLWNNHCGSLAGIVGLSASRRKKIKARLGENPDLTYWESCIKKMAASNFCQQGKWATFDWLVANDNNHVKVSEGKYDNPKLLEVRKSVGIRSQMLT